MVRIHTHARTYTYVYMRVAVQVLVFVLYLGDHFSWFKGLAKVSRENTRKDRLFSRKMCDSSVVQ